VSSAVSWLGLNNAGMVVGVSHTDQVTTIVMHALHWPDAFPASDGLLLRATGVSSPSELRARAEKWRPWRAYAALHLWLGGEDGKDA
jgi:3-methyladenine DNA glycosylase/8-oxoguanine DNA glycosylase